MAHILTDSDTKHIADLIKISIPVVEIPKYTSQLNTVLQAVPVLQELNTEGVAEASQTHGLKNVLREDTVEKGLDIREYPNRQNIRNTSFIVKQVL